MHQRRVFARVECIESLPPFLSLFLCFFSILNKLIRQGVVFPEFVNTDLNAARFDKRHLGDDPLPLHDYPE